MKVTVEVSSQSEFGKITKGDKSIDPSDLFGMWKNNSRSMIIKPVDGRRKTLYNRIFQRNFDDIDLTFDIIGVNDSEEELYNVQKNYDNFKITLKFDK